MKKIILVLMFVFTILTLAGCSEPKNTIKVCEDKVIGYYVDPEGRAPSVPITKEVCYLIEVDEVKD